MSVYSILYKKITRVEKRLEGRIEELERREDESCPRPGCPDIVCPGFNCPGQVEQWGSRQ